MTTQTNTPNLSLSGPAPPGKGLLKPRPLQGCQGCLPNVPLPRDGLKPTRQGQPIQRTKSGVAITLPLKICETDAMRFTNTVIPFIIPFQ